MHTCAIVVVVVVLIIIAIINTTNIDSFDDVFPAVGFSTALPSVVATSGGVLVHLILCK